MLFVCVYVCACLHMYVHVCVLSCQRETEYTFRTRITDTLDKEEQKRQYKLNNTNTILIAKKLANSIML